MSQDKTLIDNDRRPLNLKRDNVAQVLPEYFRTDNPLFVNFLDKYYEWMDSGDNPSRRIQDLYKNRDVTQVEEGLLQYIEDELLLGQSYFEGFINKREAAKFSNTLYRSKGTLFAIQQFFRAFFGQDPDVRYTKENVFRVGPALYDDGTVYLPASEIGPESQRFLTDDKLYQTLALLIKVGIPISKWIDVYKLFVHPAGMYVGAELQIVAVNANTVNNTMPEEGDRIISDAIRIGVATLFSSGIGEDTLLFDSDGVVVRQDPYFTARRMQDITLQEILDKQTSMQDLLTVNSPTLDRDSDGSGGGAIRLSQDRWERLDQDLYSMYISDSSGTTPL